MIRKKKKTGAPSKKNGAHVGWSIVLLSLLFSLVLHITFSAPPTPHGLAGTIHHADGTTQVALGTPFWVNDSNSGDTIRDETMVPVPGYSGRYSVSIYGNNYDHVIVFSWNTTHFGRTNITLMGDMDNINVTLNQTRTPEANVSIVHPSISTAYNVSDYLNVTANITLMGGSGTQCNATIEFSNESVFNTTSQELHSQQLGSLQRGDSLTIVWNVTAVWLGSSDITVSALCLESDIMLEANGQQTITNITAQDVDPPTIILLGPENNTITPNNTLSFSYTVNDTATGTKNCSLIINNTQYQSNTSIHEELNQSFSQFFTMGYYLWYIFCYDYANNSVSSDIRNLTITDPDLFINASYITLSHNNPQENQTITINATIFNLGNEDAENVIVEFIEIDSDGTETQIGSNHTVNITQGINISVAATYLTKVGYHTITVRVDPPLSSNGSIVEPNENNNAANITISIPIWQIYFGDVIGNIFLSNSLNLSLFTWFNVSAINGNIYVADSESTIDWTALQALSRNTSGDLQIEDFELLDIALNYTNMSDSVNTTYTEGGQVRNTDNYTVYGTQIEYVPVANSTNNSLFSTGVLWDTSDGAPDYSGSEDVIFITKVQNMAEGKFGIYNFEIRVPANLKKYASDTHMFVSFYVELS